jgi:RNA polymerase primary sigma factor
VHKKSLIHTVWGESCKILHCEVYDLLRKLMPREQKVLRLRFGIGNNRKHTLKEISQLYHVTAQRIRQIEQRAIRKLWTPPPNIS